MGDRTFSSRLGGYLPVVVHTILAAVVIGMAVYAPRFFTDGVRGWMPEATKFYFRIVGFIYQWDFSIQDAWPLYLAGFAVGDYFVIRYFRGSDHSLNARRWTIAVTFTLVVLIACSVWAVCAPSLQVWYLNR